MKLLLALMTLTLIQQFPLHADSLSLMPYPKKIKSLNNHLDMPSILTYQIKGESGRVPAYLKSTVDFLNKKHKTKLRLKDSAEGFLTIENKSVANLEPVMDERYSLTVNKNGVIIKSETDLGAIRALETLFQLTEKINDKVIIQQVEIEDEPRFSWRGLMIDVSRHFIPMDVLKQNIDGMAAMKMNVLHLHLTDDQGFRIESKKFPKLHQLGSDGQFYTQEQVKEIIKYADDRGIRVVPELDLPGHATSWFVAYPEFASAPGPYSIEKKFGIFDPAFDPTNEKVYEFLDVLFKEMADLFPDPYLHIGGDENNGKHWQKNEKIQAFMKEKGFTTNHDLQAYFTKRLSEIVTKHGKKMMGWEEILSENLPKETVMHSWRGANSLKEAVKKGYPVVLSRGYYIDLIFSAERHYKVDPIPEDTLLTEKEKNLILGGEATMWTEYVSAETMDSRIWPRTAAIAERFWSPKEVTDVPSMFARLKKADADLELRGLTHNSYQKKILEQIAGNKNIKPLETLVSVIEPVKEYARSKQGIDYTTSTSLTQLVDAAKPDAEDAKIFNEQVKTFLKTPTPEAAKQLIDKLKTYKNLHQQLEKYPGSQIKKEVLPVSKALESISLAGIEALNVFLNKARYDKSKHQLFKESISTAKNPISQCEIMITNSIDKLVRDFYKTSK